MKRGGIEGIRRRALLTVAGCKLAGELLSGVASLFHSIGKTVDGVSGSVFLVESDAARTYRDITGVDLAAVLGKNGDYDEADPMWAYAGDDDDGEEGEVE